MPIVIIIKIFKWFTNLYLQGRALCVLQTCVIHQEIIIKLVISSLPPTQNLKASQMGRIHLQCRSRRRHRFNPWVGKISWRRAWQPAPVFLLGESPWTEEPRVRHDWAVKTNTRRKFKFNWVLGSKVLETTMQHIVPVKNITDYHQSKVTPELWSGWKVTENMVKIIKLCRRSFSRFHFL